jgi:rhodanese-related sulfurtransferase
MDEAREVAADEAITLVAGNVPLVDVRERYEWDAGHAPQAVLLPMSELEDRLSELPEGEFLLICHSGARSGRVAAFLAREGREAVNVNGGMVAWQQAGGPVVSEGPGAPRV